MTLIDQIQDILARALRAAQADGRLPNIDVPDITVERPNNPEHGDFASSSPMKFARLMRRAPFGIAESIAASTETGGILESAVAARPGFVNLRLSAEWLGAQVDAIRHAGRTFGVVDDGKGARVQVEFVSVNPTGPIHVGHGRGAVFISIDDNEQHHLRAIMDEIFGEENFRNIISVARVKKNIGGTERIRALNRGYNFVLFYAKSQAGLIRPPTTFQEKGERWHAFDAPGETSTAYELFGMRPPKGRHWMYSKERADRLISSGRLRPNPRTGKPQYLLNPSNSTMLDSNWTDVQEYDTKFDFPNGEKNVDLIQRIIGMVADRDDIILDSFAGSGTTAHAVLALNKEDGGNRKFILVECEDYADTTTAERVRRVISGVPDARDKSLRDGLGGSFTYCTLGQPIELEAMLSGSALPSYSALAAYLLHASSGISAGGDELQARNDDGLFYSSREMDYCLLYEPDIAWLRSGRGMLGSDRARRIGGAARVRGKGRKAVVFGPGKYIGQRDLTNMGVTFCQIPYELHAAG